VSALIGSNATAGGALLVVIGLIGLATVVAVVSYVRELPRGRGTVAGWAAWDAPKSQSAPDGLAFLRTLHLVPLN